MGGVYNNVVYRSCHIRNPLVLAGVIGLANIKDLIEIYPLFSHMADLCGALASFLLPSRNMKMMEEDRFHGQLCEISPAGKGMAMVKGMHDNPEVAEKLISYARENPRASDTAEGIAKWWVKMSLEEVLPALEWLVERGTWEQVRREDGVLYRPVRNVEAKGTP